jgi:sec-independent protein translocase protein TatA
VPNIGLSELIVILMILLLVFGASRLPQLGESLGRTVRGFKRGIASDDKIAVQRPDASQPDAAAPSSKRDADVAEADIVERKG